MAKKDKARPPVADEADDAPAGVAAAPDGAPDGAWTRTDWLLVLVLVLASFLLHVWRLEIPNEQIFDEVYHARTALEYINGQDPYEWTHPPLGKLLIALGVMGFGFNGFGFRIVPCVAGALSTGLLYALAWQIFRSRWIAVVSAVLINLDGVFFVQSRVAMVNIFVYAFQLLSWLFLWRYLIRRTGTPRGAGPIARWLASNDFNLCLAGIGYGLAISTRWSANFVLAAMLTWLAWERLHEWIMEVYGEQVRGRPRRPMLWRLAARVPWGWMAVNAVLLPYLLVVPWLLYLAAPVAAGGAPVIWGLPAGPLKVLFVVSLVPLLAWLAAAPPGSGRRLGPFDPLGAVLAVAVPAALGALYAQAYYQQVLVDPRLEWVRWNRLFPGLWWDFFLLYFLYTVPVIYLLLHAPALRWAGRLVLYLLYIPSFIYLLTYIPWLRQLHSAWEVIWKQKDMWGYHANLNASHPYYSPWWSWPWLSRPTWYYYAHDTPDNIIWGIDAIGNPAIWWASVPATLALLLAAGYGYRRYARHALLPSLLVFLTGGLLFCASLWLAWFIGPANSFNTRWHNYVTTFNIPREAYFLEVVPFLWVAALLWAIYISYRVGGPAARVAFPSPLVFVVLGFAFAWLPWGTSPRQRIYLHYLFEGIPFACMAIAFLSHRLWESPRGPLGERFNRYVEEYWGPYLPEAWHRAVAERGAARPAGRWLAAAFLLLALACFAFFYPMVSAYPMLKWYYQLHIWPLPWANWI